MEGFDHPEQGYREIERKGGRGIKGGKVNLLTELREHEEKMLRMTVREMSVGVKREKWGHTGVKVILKSMFERLKARSTHNPPEFLHLSLHFWEFSCH